MTVLAHPTLDDDHAAAPALPRLLRAVPTDPPYEDEQRPAPVPFPPLALVLPRPAATAFVLPTYPQAGDDADEGGGRAVEAELRRLFGRRRTARCELPPPGPRAATAVRLLLEVVVGERPARQVAGWVSPRVLSGLEHRSPAQRTALGRRPMLRSVRVTEPAEAVAEVSAVVSLGERVRAVAMRLEGLDGRWTVTALRVG